MGTSFYWLHCPDSSLMMHYVVKSPLCGKIVGLFKMKGIFTAGRSGCLSLLFKKKIQPSGNSVASFFFFSLLYKI